MPEVTGVAWGLARRDLRVHRWRSLLIVVLVLLPVMAVTAGAVVIQSNQATRPQTVTRELGATQARLGWLTLDENGQACAQLSTTWDYCASEDRFTVRPAESLADAAPPGFRVLSVKAGQLDVLKQVPGTSGLPRVVPLAVMDVGAPEFAGMLDLVEGRPASGPEVVVSRPWLREFGVRVGDSVTTDTASYPIVGVVAAPTLKSPRLYVPSGHSLAMHADVERVYLDGDDPLGWDQVAGLNRQGVGVYSRAVALEAPLTYAGDQAGRLISLLSVAGTLGATLLMFVAGSAFAVGVRGQRRQLGLLGAVGAPLGVLRRIVLGQAALLGGIGSAIGVFLGIVVGLGVAWGLSVTDTVTIWGYHVPWPVLAAVALVGTIACLVAAWAPAQSVSKVDALEAVRSAEIRTPPARFPWVGLAVFALGAVATGAAVAVGRSGVDPWAWQLVLMAAVMTGWIGLLLGVVLSLNYLVALVARWIPRRPLAARLAVRELDRSRARVVPAVAAGLVAATLATTLAANNAGVIARDRVISAMRVQPGHVVIPPTSEGKADPARVKAAVERVVPVAGVSVLNAVEGVGPGVPEESRCPDERSYQSGDPRCRVSSSTGYPHLVAGGIPELTLLLGRVPSSDEAAALASGALLTSESLHVADGKATMNEADPATAVEPGGMAPAPTPVLVAAHVVEPDGPAGWSIMSPDAMAALGRPQASTTLVVELSAPASDAELDRIEAALRDQQVVGILPRDPSRAVPVLGWSAVGAAGVLLLAIVGLVTALGMAESRRDDVTLASVGAPPGLRRSTTALQVLVVTALGALLGSAVAGISLTALAHSQPRDAMPLAVPGWELLALVVAAPLLGATVTWLVVAPSPASAARRLT